MPHLYLNKSPFVNSILQIFAGLAILASHIFKIQCIYARTSICIDGIKGVHVFLFLISSAEQTPSDCVGCLCVGSTEEQ